MRRSLTRAELETTLHEIEGVINSRPLTFVGDTIENQSPLTPSHFLIGKGNVYEKEQSSFEQNEKSLKERKFLRDELMNKFWNIWSQKYIKS